MSNCRMLGTRNGSSRRPNDTSGAELPASTAAHHEWTRPPPFQTRLGAWQIQWRRRIELEGKAGNLFALLPCEPIPPSAGDRCAAVKAPQQRRGLPLDENDLLVAATAIVLDANLVRICLEINYSELSNTRLDFVVPVAMEVVTADLHLGQFFVSDFDAGLIGFGIQLGMDLQSCLGGRRRD